MDLHIPLALQVLVADTVVTIQARDRIALAADLAILVAAGAMTVLSLVLVRVLNRWYRTVAELRTMVHQNLGPVSDRARSITENVQFITEALRADVTRLNDAVTALTGRLHQASSHMEDRIEEFNALMEVVQSEAEDVFLDTAATVRGVREGARAMGRRRSPRPPDADGDQLPADDGGERDGDLPPAEPAGRIGEGSGPDA